MNRVSRALLVVAALCALTGAQAASDKEPPPAGAFKGAPAEYTKFATAEIVRGFMALAFGSDMRIGARPKGVRRFDRPVKIYVQNGGSTDRTAQMKRVIAEYAAKIPTLKVSEANATESADVLVRLIDEKDFASALVQSFGRATARAFVAKTNPQCMTSVRSRTDGVIERAVSFIIVDKGEDVFLDCAYHELLHAFGLSSHDQRNPWTTLNQKRMVGYLTVYDRALLTLLYDPRLPPGTDPAKTRRLLPALIESLHLGQGRRENGG